MTPFSERLKLLRTMEGKNQAEIAEVIGASVQSYSAYESGREPKYEMLCILCDYFGVTADYLLGREDVRSREHADTAKATGLSARAMEQMDLLKQDKSHIPSRVLSYLIECASPEFYRDLYCFLLAKLYFCNPSKDGEIKEMTEVYKESAMLAYKEGEHYRAFEVDSKTLNMFFFSKVQAGLIELQEGAANSMLYEDIQNGRM